MRTQCAMVSRSRRMISSMLSSRMRAAKMPMNAATAAMVRAFARAREARLGGERVNNEHFVGATRFC